MYLQPLKFFVAFSQLADYSNKIHTHTRAHICTRKEEMFPKPRVCLKTRIFQTSARGEINRYQTCRHSLPQLQRKYMDYMTWLQLYNLQLYWSSMENKVRTLCLRKQTGIAHFTQISEISQIQEMRTAGPRRCLLEEVCVIYKQNPVSGGGGSLIQR